MPGRKKIKGHVGKATKYVSRSKATRHMRLSLSDFNKLCILKGIYPRVPKNKGSTNAIHYHTNDLSFIRNDKVIEDMDKQKAFDDMLRHKKNRGELTRDNLFRNDRPELNIDHIIRERYPTFQDALEDIDDAITSALLYSSLTTSKFLSATDLAEFRRLANEFCLYCMVTRAVTKVFFSTRGIYYAVQLPGCSKETVFVAPHDLVQKMPKDIDRNVIDSFALLHRTLLSNVMPKLYSDMGLDYPPELPSMTTVSLVPLCHELQKKIVRQESLPLSGVVCLVSRECPMRTLEMTIEGAGGYIVRCSDDDGKPLEPLTTPITHVVIDRLYTETLIKRLFDECGEKMDKNVIVTVPQYMLDCVNAQCLLPPTPYTPINPPDGTPFRPPPHRSPFSVAASVPTTTIRRETPVAKTERPVEDRLGEVSKALGTMPTKKQALLLSLQSMSRRDKRLLNRNLRIENRERKRARPREQRMAKLAEAASASASGSGSGSASPVATVVAAAAGQSK